MAKSQDQPITLTGSSRRTITVPSVLVTVTSPKGETVEAKLGLAPLLIGSSSECDLVVKDPRLSRRHCELTLTGQGILIKDMGSKNGTLIGEVRVVEAVLSNAFTAVLGGSTLKVHKGDTKEVIALSRSASFGDAIGRSISMRALFARLEVAAPTNETILLLGESGTGKELLARGIHQASPRKNGPLVVLDCTALNPNLAESQLFGHEKGAFTGADKLYAGPFEQAHGGTLFLDEIGELPLDLQPKLLRALENHEVSRVGGKEFKNVDVRIVAATNRDLPARAAAGSFREDLYYRLAVVEARVPPLRERKDDIPLLVERFLDLQSPARTIDDLPAHTIDLFLGHRWQGNVRELRSMVTRLVLFGEQELGSLSSDSASTGQVGDWLNPLLSMPWKEARETVVERFARSYLPAMIQKHTNITLAAKAMGVSRQFLHELMDKYGIRSDGGVG